MVAVKLKVADLQRACDFYVDHLGMIEGTHYNQWEWELEPAAGAETRVILYCDPNGNLDYQFGTSWLLLRVDDALATGEQLRSAGVEVRDPIKMGDTGVVLVFAEDLDGNLLELVSG
jgi:catechol 2,3-dioxygenase-like lactoylglutathione lyase family enzyme